MTDLLGGFWQRHSLTCPCGATCNTDDKQIFHAWIEAHKEHLATSHVNNAPHGVPEKGK